jgi:hypothetical protein
MKQHGWWIGGVALGVYIVASAAVVWTSALRHFTALDQVIAVLGTIAATIAAAYGALSYGAIQEQLKLARRELVVVEQQIRESQRRPNLRVCFSDGKTNHILSAPSKRVITLRFSVMNNGTRTATNVRYEVYVPWSLTGSHYGVKLIGTSQYALFVFVRLSVWSTGYPTLEPGIVSSEIPVRLEPKMYKCLWRIYDDFGRYPEDEDYGTLFIEVTD